MVSEKVNYGVITILITFDYPQKLKNPKNRMNKGSGAFFAWFPMVAFWLPGTIISRKGDVIVSVLPTNFFSNRHTITNPHLIFLFHH